MFYAIRYNKDKKHYVLFIQSSDELSNYCHGDLFENGNHKKAFLWHSRISVIKDQLFNNLNSRGIKAESGFRYNGNLSYHIHKDTFKDVNLLSL